MCLFAFCSSHSSAFSGFLSNCGGKKLLYLIIYFTLNHSVMTPRPVLVSRGTNSSIFTAADASSRRSTWIHSLGDVSLLCNAFQDSPLSPEPCENSPFLFSRPRENVPLLPYPSLPPTPPKKAHLALRAPPGPPSETPPRRELGLP